jgi:hypothetical protein
MPPTRTYQFKILLSEKERAWLEAVARKRGLSASDILRLHITALAEEEGLR